MKYDLMITDFDGTLGCGTKIEPETVEAIREYIKRGGLFCICTGRHYHYIKDICKRYNIDGLLSICQGALIIDYKTGEEIFSGGLENETASKLARAIDKDGYPVTVYFKDKLFYDSYSSYAESYRKEGIMPIEEVKSIPDYIRERGEKALKLIVSSPDGKLREKEEEYRKEIGGTFEFNTSGGPFVEIINPECSKGEAVKRLAKYYGIPYEKIITVGDAENDIHLIEGEWHGVAVGDGDPRLKAKAKEVTVPYKDQPIKYLLEKYCLKK